LVIHPQCGPCYNGPLGERSCGANRGTDYNVGIADKAAFLTSGKRTDAGVRLLEDVAMLHNLNAILSVPRIGPQRTRLVAFQPTLVSGGVGSV
jgi:hypothetical protein